MPGGGRAAIIQGLKAASETSNVASLRIIASLALLLHEASTKSAYRSEDAQLLITHVVETASAVATSLRDAETSTLSESLIESLRQLQRTVENVARHLQKNSEGYKFAKLIGVSNEKTSVKRLEDELEKAISLVMLQAKLQNLSLSQKLNENEVAYQDLLDMTMASVKTEQQEKLNTPGSSISFSSSRSGSPQHALPSAPQIFYGRSGNLEHAVAQLQKEEQAHIAILGGGGIGKTSLALAILHHPEILLKFGDLRFFFSCEGSPDVNTLAASLGKHLNFGQHDLIRSLTLLLKNASSPALLCLDNFETPWEPASNRLATENLLSALVQISGLSVIVTLRGSERPLGVRWSRPHLPPLGRLDMESARMAFLAISDVSDKDPLVGRLLDLMDGIPLAVTLMANLAQSCPCAELLDMWEVQKTAMLTRGYDARLSSIDVSIQVSLNSERLTSSKHATFILRVLSLLPEGATKESLIDMTSVGKIHLVSAIATLRQSALIYESPTAQIRVLCPIREHMLARGPLDSTEARPVWTYHFNLAGEIKESIINPSNPNRLGWIRPQMANISAVILHALDSVDPPADAVHSVLDLRSFVEAPGASPRLLLSAMDVAQALGERKLAADCMARTYRFTAIAQDAHKSRKLLETALEIYAELESEDTGIDRAYCLKHLGFCLIRLGEVDAGLAAQQESIDLCRQAKASAELAESLNCLARSLLDCGRPWDALILAREAKEIAEEHNIPIQRAYVLNSLGHIYFDRSAFLVALSYFQKSQALCLEIYGEGGTFVAGLEAMAKVYHRLSWFDEAQDYYTQANSLWEKIDLVTTDYDPIANNLRGLGSLAFAKGHLEVAIERYQRSLTRFELYGFFYDQALCHAGIAQVESTRGQHSAAMTRLLKARDLCRKQGVLNVNHGATVHFAMGDVAFASGELPTATTFFVVSGAIYRKVEQRLGLGISIMKLGDLALVDDRISDAKSCYLATWDMIRYLGSRCNLADVLCRLGDVAIREGQQSVGRQYIEEASLLYRKAGALTALRKTNEMTINGYTHHTSLV
ncbi:hypothetical protein SISNIDRAFT_455598 [Sistotremastrum niveocremeum HHB9708]|uniref:TPR-like protein n=1 Tax=Sistotremastrum niveocremeum HHB9708 TaxID=1314777 RepID=A0A164TJI2_9AGAM|nr:hypothetical protein SISNIDRAFT_455598 [Sistotremastrum niveocremeum HHB9708]